MSKLKQRRPKPDRPSRQQQTSPRSLFLPKLLPPLTSLNAAGSAPPQSPLLKQPSLPSLPGQPLPAKGVDLSRMQAFSKVLARRIRNDPQVQDLLDDAKRRMKSELGLNQSAVNQPQVLAELARQLLQNQSFLASVQAARDQAV